MSSKKISEISTSSKELTKFEKEISNIKTTCGICGSNTAYTTIEHIKEISIRGKIYKVDIPNYRVLYCDLCQDGIVFPESVKAFEKAAKEITDTLDIKKVYLN